MVITHGALSLSLTGPCAFQTAPKACDVTHMPCISQGNEGVKHAWGTLPG